MIKVNRNHIKACGNSAILLAELAGIIRSFREEKFATDEEIRYAVELGMNDRKEENEDILESLNHLSKDELKDFVKNYLMEEGDSDDF